MRSTHLVLALALAGGAWTSTARAEIGAMDPVPSATLLFPYFQVDPDATSGDTVLSIENTAAMPQLAHVIVWSDRGVPVHDFDVYLTAHEQLTLSMRALLAGQRPTSAAGAGVGGCSFPLNALGSSVVADLRAALTGQHIPSVADANLGCPGADHGDGVARGYVTVDTVIGCNTTQVTSGTYWATRLAMNNTLVGQFVMSEGDGRPAYAEQAVHIEAGPSDPRVDSPGDATFYGRLVSYTAADRRERLPTQWSVEAAATRSDVIVWRETKRTETNPASVGCSTAAQAALDLRQGSLNFFSEAEAFTAYGDGSQSPFVFATGRHAVGGASGLPTPYRSGMFTLHTNFADAADVPAVMGLAQSVVLGVRYPDAVSAPTHGTLAFGTPIDDGFDPMVAGNTQPTSDYGVMGSNRPYAMMDPRAAAALVLPYFEVSLDDPNEAQTQFSIVNNTASAGLVLVTLFTDRGVPTRTFNVYLTGYDIAVVDLRMLFLGGLESRSASDGQDPQDTITPQGPISQDINFASCGGQLPSPVLDEADLTFLRQAHTGQPVDAWDGACGGRDLDDGIARGYIVVDDLTGCMRQPITELDFFGYVGGRNNFSGTFEVRNRTDDFSYGGPLIPLHRPAAALLAGDMTFYGWLGGWTASGTSRREALPSRWRVPFLNSAAAGSTELIFFRPVHRTPAPYACSAVPASFVGGVATLTAYDASQNSTGIGGFVPGFVAGRVPIGAAGIETPYARGSLEFDLDFIESGAAPSPLAGAHMGFVGAVHRVAGIADPVFSQGFPLQLAGEP